MKTHFLVQIVITAIVLSCVSANDCETFSKLAPDQPSCQEKNLIYTKGTQKYYLFSSKVKAYLIASGLTDFLKSDTPFPSDHIPLLKSVSKNDRDFHLFELNEWFVPFKVLSEIEKQFDANEIFMHFLADLTRFVAVYHGGIPSLELDNLIFNIQHKDFVILSISNDNPQNPVTKRLTSLDPDRDDEEEEYNPENKLQISQETLSQLITIYDFLATVSTQQSMSADEDDKDWMNQRHEKAKATLQELDTNLDLQKLLSYFTDSMFDQELRMRKKQDAQTVTDPEDEDLHHSREWRNKMIVFFIGAALILAVISVPVYFFLSKRNNDNTDRAFSERIVS